MPVFVFAVGHNDQFIYCQQMPYYLASDSVVRDSVQYYIIEQTDYFVQNKPVYGPLNREGFDSACKKLKITTIDFDINYEEIIKVY